MLDTVKTLHVCVSWVREGVVELNLSLPDSRGRIIPEEGATCIRIQALPAQLCDILAEVAVMIEEQDRLRDGTSLGWAVELIAPGTPTP